MSDIEKLMPSTVGYFAMISRRKLVAAVGGVAALGGCLSGSPPTAEADADSEQSANRTEPVAEEIAEPEPPERTDPVTTTRLFYEALITGQKAALNRWFVHPESPTYPIEDHHLPPAQFEPFETIQIVDIRAVSVQDRIVQRLFPEVTRSSRIRREMGASGLQYVHTTLYATLAADATLPGANESDEIAVDETDTESEALDDSEITVDSDAADPEEADSDEPTVYVADTVDYLVRDDGQWYIRYNAD